MFDLLLSLRSSPNLFYCVVFLIALLAVVVCLQILAYAINHGITVTHAGVVLLIAIALGSGYIIFNKNPCVNGLGNANDLSENLEGVIFGQEVAVDAIVMEVNNHRTSKRRQPLVLSFHGPTGTGKSMTAVQIAKFMYGYTPGEQQTHSNVYIFEKEVNKGSAEYRVYIKDTLEQALSNNCGSMFIFEHMDEMPTGIGNVLKSVIAERNTSFPCQNEAIFILISNIGGKTISSVTLQNWLDGFGRENVLVSELKRAIDQASESADAPRWHRRMMENNLISANIPFLPLERHHVKHCLLKEMFNINENDFLTADDRKLAHHMDVRNIMRHIEFFPKSHQVYSYRGCMDLSKAIDYVIRN